MTEPAKSTAEPMPASDDEHEFVKFQELARKLISVPKTELAKLRQRKTA